MKIPYPPATEESEFDLWTINLVKNLEEVDADKLRGFSVPAPTAADDDYYLLYDHTNETYDWQPGGASGVNCFKTITGITNDVVADAAADTLTLSSANNLLTIVGTAASDTITFTVVEGNIDHGSLAGLNDADHNAIYYTETEIDAWRNSVTQTEMGYLHGLTSDLQTQLDARCLESVFGTSISTGLLLDGTTLKVSAVLQKYHAIDPSIDVQSLLDCANEAAIRAFLDLEAGTDFPSLTTFNDHSARHENAGADEISVAGLSGELADAQPPKIHASKHTDGTDDIQDATAAQKGLMTAAYATKLDGIETGATKYPDTGEQAFLDADHTKLDGIEAGADITDATNVNAAGATMNTDTDVSGNSWVLDEDNMVSDDATRVPTQQSVKAYVDAEVAGAGGVSLKTGTYTGDGELSQGITGVGFQPKYVQIWQDLGAAEGLVYITETTDVHTTGYSVYYQSSAGALQFYQYDNRIISLDADGFTVDDDGSDVHPNKNGTTYRYVALG